VIHLDTGFLIRALVSGSREDRLLRTWLRVAEPIGLSAVSWTEFLCGPVEDGHVELAARLVGEPEPFSADDCTVTARLFNRGGRRRGSFTDCMIAAVAIRVGAMLATTNRADFVRFRSDGLRLAEQ
jgi:predicted nucleic acid-binding protein